MATFRIREVEGMRQVCIDVKNETVRAAHGALSNMNGNISFTPKLPNFGDLFRSIFTRESRIRPYYNGTGTINLQPSLRGYHVFDVQPGERWILEPGVYWASEGGVNLGLTKEPFWSSFWAGDGLFAWKTTMAGQGQTAVNAPGPVEVIDVKDGEIKVQGRLVLGRSGDLAFKSKRAAPFPRSIISGQDRLRIYQGTGKVLVSWTPYWNQHLYQRMTDADDVDGSLFQ
ncbi:hypothetical protein C1J03_11725 [Sulfitobacter sp. SK012]|uniref:AIM24 family protein n=1 Tax=Sulfitobacter sp. SK012 TaxID=1389005 RepID=UPI000E0B6154|nr:AIM24 family protein [Sulfitobacter sp. SK012]AXI46629.1 hypothetical protein C1J03_11725 [Sulfitobacter sp. SK012]